MFTSSNAEAAKGPTGCGDSLFFPKPSTTVAMTSFFPLPQNKRGGRAKSLLDTRDQAAFISNDSPGRVVPPMKLSAALVLKEVSDWLEEPA